MSSLLGGEFSASPCEVKGLSSAVTSLSTGAELSAASLVFSSSASWDEVVRTVLVRFYTDVFLHLYLKILNRLPSSWPWFLNSTLVLLLDSKIKLSTRQKYSAKLSHLVLVLRRWRSRLLCLKFSFCRLFICRKCLLCFALWMTSFIFINLLVKEWKLLMSRSSFVQCDTCLFSSVKNLLFSAAVLSCHHIQPLQLTLPHILFLTLCSCILSLSFFFILHLLHLMAPWFSFTWPVCQQPHLLSALVRGTKASCVLFLLWFVCF